MGGLSIGHWIVLLIIVLLVFGSGKLKNFGSDLGSAIKGFKKAMSEDDTKTNSEKSNITHQANEETKKEAESDSHSDQSNKPS